MANQNPPDEYEAGYVDFAGCRIGLGRRPLIPRPETEFWTRAAIIELARLGREIRVLDIFSGSGCVGVAVAKHIARAHIDFADIDPAAVAQIKINLDGNGIEKKRAAVFESDIFSKIPVHNRYDAILANPPYIDPARISEVQGSVLDHEPHAALFGGRGGLEVIGKFLKEAKNFLKPGGFIYLEFDPSQCAAIEDMAQDFGYGKIDFYKDQYKIFRYAKITVY
jgi:release factor glutamine methyltransferase